MHHLLRALTPSQCSAVLASYLGWTVDAFDFFILVFVIDNIAEEFGIRRAPAHRELGKFGYANSLNFQNCLETDAREYFGIRSDGTG